MIAGWRCCLLVVTRGRTQADHGAHLSPRDPRDLLVRLLCCCNGEDLPGVIKLLLPASTVVSELAQCGINTSSVILSTCRLDSDGGGHARGLKTNSNVIRVAARRQQGHKFKTARVDAASATSTSMRSSKTPRKPQRLQVRCAFLPSAGVADACHKRTRWHNNGHAPTAGTSVCTLPQKCPLILLHSLRG